MKGKEMKNSRLMIVILSILALINGLAYAGSLYINSSLSTTTTDIIRGPNMIQIEFYGQIIPTNSYIEFGANFVGAWDGIETNIAAVSTGSITTASVVAIQREANNTVLSTTEHTISSAFTTIDSAFLLYRIYNPVSDAPAEVTGSVLIYDN